MAVALTGTRIASDRSDVFAVSVGGGRWITERLRGRTFTTVQALGVVQFADAIGAGQELYPLDHPVWIEAGAWLRSVGLAIHEAVLLLELPCDPRELPGALTRPGNDIGSVDNTSPKRVRAGFSFTASLSGLFTSRRRR